MTLDAALDLLRCPRCRGSLTRDDGSLRCPQGHSFDVARQGYVNLRSGPPPANADTAAMVAARAAFLAGGHYEPIADAVAAAVPERVTKVLDCGAGTGYYAARVLSGTAARRGLALDVSVPAAKRAARAHGRMAAVVADAWQPLPVADAAIEVVLNVFAPRNPDEFRRVLVGDGILITVVPTAAHLAELREPLQLLDQQPEKSDRLDAALAGRFRHGEEHPVVLASAWDEATARLAVMMGPNAFHLSPTEVDRRLATLSWPRQVTVSCRVGVWHPLSELSP